MTKEKPILMSAPMVLAILAGTKTQTRRIVMPQPVKDEGNFRKMLAAYCPYGGQWARNGVSQLWVRETFVVMNQSWFADHRPISVRYKADADTSPHLVFRPSIFMPRWASRITLEIVSVRVERLNEISEADCRAEGCHGGHGSIPGYGFSATPKEHFRALWDGLNAKRGFPFESAPFVWVLEFKRITP